MAGQHTHLPLKRGWEALDWKTRNQTLFAALKLERVVAFVVLVFIILVASFSIVSTLTMSVIETVASPSLYKEVVVRLVAVGGSLAAVTLRFTCAFPTE